VITTEAGVAALREQGVASHVEVVAAGSESVEPRAIVAALHGRGARVVLCEGGPHLFGQMLRDRLIDDLFLTLAPQVAGRAMDTPRLSLVEGAAFTVADAPWSRLVDLRRSDNHLFARYRFEEIHS
jgi:riboflavin biosynthesis pyrimidine reductase